MPECEHPTAARPTQAVVLAGGRGTRLAPLTDDKPKPMIEFGGRPFLAYLIEHLREQGFQRVLLLLGYRAAMIQDYFGDGSGFGLAIDYSVTDEAHDTGERVRRVAERVDAVFLLLYCDNYWPMPFAAMWHQFQSDAAAEVLAQVTVYRNRDGYTRSNLIIDEEQRVRLYDKTRTADGLEGVDIGFILMRREALELLPAGNVNLEATLYPQLIERRQLTAFTTEHRYYSVGSHARLAQTAHFLEREPTVLLDRDGVLNKKAARAEYVCSWNEWAWLPGARDAIGQLCDEGVRVLVVSNQAGIARGKLTHAGLEELHARLTADLAELGAQIERFYVCPHGWQAGCLCRKPEPGMLLQAQRDFDLDLSRTYFIGDDERDAEAGRRAGCRTLLVDSEHSLYDLVRDHVLEDPATPPLLRPLS